MLAGNSLVAVIGSANQDVVVHVDRFPAPGETILGGGVVEVAGGKGLNQALAAARGTPTALVCCVGDDDAGRALRDEAHAHGIDVSEVCTVHAPTGRAFIQVAPDGENSIVVASGANSLLAPDHVLGTLRRLAPAVVLAQLEIPLESVICAAEWAQANKARFLLNPSPSRDLPPSLLEACDPLVANAAEATSLTGGQGRSVDDLVSDLMTRTRSVVVTDGPRGSWVGSKTGVAFIPALAVEAIDTTGAGDEFTGTLAARLALGDSLELAATAASAAAGQLVARPRTQR